MGSIRIKQRFRLPAGRTKTVSINCTDDLGAYQLSGTPIVTPPTGSGFTIESETINSSEYTEKTEVGGDTVAANHAIQWVMTAPTTSGEYVIEFYSATTDPNGDEVFGEVTVEVP